MATGEFWVFGYGSLMWRPDFRYSERRMADLHGYRRSFCIRSVHYRGTEEAPGLVLGLDFDPSASCRGVAFRVADADADQTLNYLRARELVTGVYQERMHPVRFAEGAPGEAEALVYVVDREHQQYAGDWSLERQAKVICRAVGPAGPNCVYLHNTVTHLIEMGVRDSELEELDALVRALDCSGRAAREV
jgi:cation transport protein ChaC